MDGDVPWGIAFGQLLTSSPTKLNHVTIDPQIPPIQLFSALTAHYETAFLLESVEGPRRLARYTFLGFEPEAVIRTEKGAVEVVEPRRSQRSIASRENPLTLLQQINKPVKEATTERYAGGLVGYAAYDLVRLFERIPYRRRKSDGFPDMEFGLFHDGIIFDHLTRKTYYFYREENRVEEIRSLSRENPPPVEKVSFGKARLNLEEEKFYDKVERVKEYISSGDVFQVVLSKRYKIPFKGSLLRLYLRLREINPSPYMYYLKFGRREIVGSSPEMLVRKIGRRIESFPIAGTRPYTADPARNRALASELLHDEKERAEHVMLVDLARNDIGRVSDYGTVHVPEFMKVQSYSHVQHIVSRVVGRLRNGFTSTDLLRAVFPAGTVTGAPKVRAMEIIQELETTARGPYAGGVGYFSANGNADFAITIRTICAQDGFCYLQSGAGIVADSVPSREWIETERKAAALFTAMDMAQE